MLSVFRLHSPLRARFSKFTNKRADCFGSHVVLTSLSSYRWFIARLPTQTRISRPLARRHPLITRRVLCLYALSSFQRTDAHRAGTPLPVAFPDLRSSEDRFWGNLLRLLEEKNSCQSLARCFCERSSKGQKNCSDCFSEQRPKRFYFNTRARGGLSEPPPATRLQRLLADETCRVPNPARAI